MPSLPKILKGNSGDIVDVDNVDEVEDAALNPSATSHSHSSSTIRHTGIDHDSSVDVEAANAAVSAAAAAVRSNASEESAINLAGNASNPFRSLKNWKDYVIVDPKRSSRIKLEVPNSNFSVEAYICKFCNHEFTYSARNGPRTISKHLQKRHPSELYNTSGSAVVAAAAAVAAVAANNMMSRSSSPSLENPNNSENHYEENSSNDQNNNNDPLILNTLQIKQYQPVSVSLPTSDLEFAIKMTTKQWRYHYIFNPEKTAELKSDSRHSSMNSKFPSEVFNCKYCNKRFVYCSRNGPGTLAKHMEKFHLPELFNNDPALTNHSEILTSPFKRDDSATSINDANVTLKEQNHGKLNPGGAFVDNNTLNNLAYIARSAKSWRLHYTKNTDKTERLKSQVAASAADDKQLKLQQEVYDCNYCPESRVYISRNGPKTLSKHLEKSHKKELLATNPTDLIATLSRKRTSENQDGKDDIFDLNTPETSSKRRRHSIASEDEKDESGTSPSIFNSSAEDNSLGSDSYNASKFHEDIIKFLNENKLYIQVVKSSSFKNLIKNLRPDYVGALDEFKSLYSSFLQIMNNAAEDSQAGVSRGNNRNDDRPILRNLSRNSATTKTDSSNSGSSKSSTAT